MWWDKIRIESHSKMYTLEEVLIGYGRYRDKRSRVGHSGSVLRGAENVDLFIRGAECLYAFVSLLAIVKAWSETVYAQVWVFDKCGLGPFSGLDTVV